MRNENNNNFFKWGITAFLVVLGGIVSCYVIFHLDNFTSSFDKIIEILMPVIDGAVLAYMLSPLVNGIEQRAIKRLFINVKIKNKKSKERLLSILITMALVVGLIYGFFSFVIPQIYNSIRTIIEQFPSYVNTVTYWIENLLEDNPEIETYVMDLINKSSIDFEQFINSKVLPQLNNVIVVVSMSVYSVLKQVWNFVIGFIISIYLLSSKELFAAQAKKITYAFMPVDRANRCISNVRFASKTFGGFFVGKILDSCIIGLICYVVTGIIGTPFNVLISVIIGVTNIIPFFGPFLGAIPSLLLILLIDPMQALYFLIFVIILQQVDGNIIGPKILGNSTGLSSFWVIFSITLFGGLWGIFGMIVGVPIFAVLFAFMKTLVETKLSTKDLSPSTAKYLKLIYIDVDTGEYVDFVNNERKNDFQISQFLIKSQEILKKKQAELSNMTNINNNTDDENDNE
jgi:predicted PurR-regulated permease PerM